MTNTFSQQDNRDRKGVPIERQLAAIFSTDVKGYSRPMGDDDEATIHTLKTYREATTELIEQHHGRVVDSPGDNMLAAFASAVEDRGNLWNEILL